jgi:CheY-like chemotaxis protein
VVHPNIPARLSPSHPLELLAGVLLTHEQVGSGMEHTQESASRPVVGIINTSEEMADVLHELLEEEGFIAPVAYVIDFKRGRADIEEFFATHQPQAVIWDIALPYVENWHYFRERILSAGFLPPERFIITTLNKSVLDILVGPTPTVELIGRPADLDTIVETVKQTLSR